MHGAPPRGQKQLEKWQESDRYEVAFAPGNFFKDSLPKLQTFLTSSAARDAPLVQPEDH